MPIDRYIGKSVQVKRGAAKGLHVWHRIRVSDRYHWHLGKIRLVLPDSLIRSYNAPEPGGTFVYEDRDLADGLHEYRAVAFNGSGEGKSFEAKAYIGINVPGAPTNAMVREHPDCRTLAKSVSFFPLTVWANTPYLTIT